MGLKNKLTSISMARLTAGATLLGDEKADAEKKLEPEQTITQKTQATRPIDIMRETNELQTIAGQDNAQHDNYYDETFLFVLSNRVQKNEPSFEFDGVTYQTKTAMQEKAA